MTGVALGRDAVGSSRGWALAVLYPVVCGVVLLFTAYPLGDLLARAVVVDARPAAQPITQLLADAHTRRVVWNTVSLGTTVALLGTALATLYAYAMTRVALPWKRLWHFVALLPTISPPILMALSLVLLYGRRGIITHDVFGLETSALYGHRGLIVAQLLSYFPFAYLLLLNLFRGLDASLEEAAGTMGAHAGKVLVTLILPLLIPGLGAAALLLFGYSLADLGNPLLLGGDFQVLSSEIYQTIIGMYDVPKGAALAVILLFPAVVLFFTQKQLAERTGFASLGGRGTLHHPQAEHPLVKAGALLLVSVVSLVIALQYAAVLGGAVTKLFGIDNTVTLRHFVAALTDSRGALIDTMMLAVAAAGVTASIGLLVAYYVERSAVVGRGALDFVANLPLAIPGTVIGLAFALAFNHRPLLLTGTAFVIIVVFTVRSLPYSVRSSAVAMKQVHRSMDEASTSMGASSGQTLMRVLVPLVRPALIAGMIFTFTRSVTTLSAVIFVVSPHWSLVTPTILSQMDRGDVGEAAALSTILVVLVLAVIHGAPRLLGRDWRAQA